ncbi:hypothetical protein K2X30_09220 [bacterium]|nr:hypothetical protein [bacterium]
MSRPTAEHSSLNLSIPGKVFLLGEYAVLENHPALVLAVDPRFELVSDSEHPTEFHSQSPAGRLLTWARKTGQFSDERFLYRFVDPYQGRGGLGASTAQFALTYQALYPNSREDWQSPWRLYRELMLEPNSIRPSGADLIAQWNTGLSLISPEAGKCESLDMNWGERGRLLIFGTTQQSGRKIETHRHLQELNPQRLKTVAENAAPIIQTGTQAVRDGDWRKFGACLNRYADLLCTYSLEVPATFEDRMHFRKIPGVFGVKGAGSLQADTLVVMAEAEAVPAVLKLAAEKNLFTVLGASG